MNAPPYRPNRPEPRGPFRLVHAAARNGAIAAIKAAPQGYVVEIKPPKRNVEQNALLHAALSDIADQVTWHGQSFDIETWKRLCTAAWLRERGESPRLVPALYGNGFDIIYQHTSELSKPDFSELCEWVFAFGAMNGVTFKEKPFAAMEGR